MSKNLMVEIGCIFNEWVSSVNRAGDITDAKKVWKKCTVLRIKCDAVWFATRLGKKIFIFCDAKFATNCKIFIIATQNLRREGFSYLFSCDLRRGSNFKCFWSSLNYHTPPPQYYWPSNSSNCSRGLTDWNPDLIHMHDSWTYWIACMNVII